MEGPDTPDDGWADREAAASVVITNHDYDGFVGAAIESALAQTVPCQVIVVDDGSTDRSLDVIGGFGERVEVVAKTNGGQASAFNVGFERCLAPVVLFLDGDDLLDPEAAAEVASALAERPDAPRCHFHLRLVDAAGQVLPGRLPEVGRALPQGSLIDRLATNPDDIAWQPTSGNAFRATTLSQILPMPTEPYRISADHYLSNLSALHGPVLAIERPLGSYRVHGGNADHRTGFDLGRARSILARTRVTRQHLIEHGRRLGAPMPAEPDRFRSLTNDALRLISARSTPRHEHPFPEDRWLTLMRRAIRSAAGRRDLTRPRRLLALVWVVALGFAPTSLLPPIASRGLTR